MTIDNIQTSLDNAVGKLTDELLPSNHWVGRLSDSALATAVAIFALSQLDELEYADPIKRGLTWLADNINDDGGWGDTPESISNASTTMLCWAAFGTSAGKEDKYKQTIQKTEKWLTNFCGSIKPEALAKAISRHYGSDKTFSAPILSMCAMSGRLGPVNKAWHLVPQLPFELSLFPRFLFKCLNLSVVSYALPALIAIGLARFRNGPECSAAFYLLRKLSTGRALNILKNIQPSNGGYLEAVPLTGFVVMSLASCNLSDHQAAKTGVKFLLSSMRDTGSWPIDTNLSIWTTTLAVNALPSSTSIPREKISNWLLSHQFTKSHPYTGANPGGWGWTDQPGSVPDADDTAGALLALKRLGINNEQTTTAVENGIAWLADLQNSDGGIPTFCRGWGKLPFDKSCPDITAHVMRAIDTWHDSLSPQLKSSANDVMHAGFCYLEKNQKEDGSWIPLWFGNQQSTQNPTYGTSIVVHALNSIAPSRLPRRDILITRGTQWLIENQNNDGGWGGKKGAQSSIEETALATKTLSITNNMEQATKGIEWLIKTTNSGIQFPSSPIGLYFASLWYDEKLYPLTFTIAAMVEWKNRNI